MCGLHLVTPPWAPRILHPLGRDSAGEEEEQGPPKPGASVEALMPHIERQLRPDHRMPSSLLSVLLK